MKYQIVTEHGNGLYTCECNLQNRVNKLCEDGWKPQGGVSIATVLCGYSTYYTICQAMIKEERR